MSDEQHIQSGRDTIQAKGDVIKPEGDYVARDKIIYTHPPVPVSETERRARRTMLQKVHKFWIAGVLESSLQQMSLIDIGIEYVPDAVAYRWEGIIERPGRSHFTLPQSTPIAAIFDEQVNALVILGEPGAGKTTMLLELARALLKRAQQDETHPIPVVFNLSSWAAKQQPLTNWLMEEFYKRYDVSPKVAHAWIIKDQILPLLDGLDEVRQEVQGSCVNAINAYLGEHGMNGMAVCCRREDYANKLKLQGAIILQQLSDVQIEDYLAQGGQPLSGVRALLQTDTAMREFARTPLILNTMIVAYQNVTAADLPTGSWPTNERRKHLLNAYIERRFKRRPNKHYSPVWTVKMLKWLAARMIEQSQTIFLLEQIQPTWLQNRKQQALYRLFVMLIIGWIFASSMRFVLGPSVGLIAGISIGVVFGLVIGRSEVKPVEALSWSWANVKLAWKATLLIPIISGFGLGFANSLVNGSINGLGFGLTSGIAGLTLSMLIAGLNPRTIDNKDRPNQGIVRSWDSAGRAGLLIGVGYGLTFGLGAWLSVRTSSGLYAGLINGLAISLFGWLIFGGIAIVKHTSLRLVFFLGGYIPWNYSAFLDYACSLVFLKRVGGGYIFIHRMLMEYFADQEFLEVFNTIVQQDPHNAIAYARRGQTYFVMGYYNEAIDTFQKALVHDPTSVDAYWMLGLTYVHLGDRSNALRIYAKALTLEQIRPMLGQSLNHILHYFHKAQTGTVGKYVKGHSPRHVFQSTTRLLHHRMLWFLSEVRNVETLGIHFEVLGQAFVESQRYGEAVTIYQQMLALDNENIQTYIEMSRTLICAHTAMRHENANLNPRHARAFVDMLNRVMVAQLEKAQRALEQVLSRDSNSIYASLLLAVVHKKQEHTLEYEAQMAVIGERLTNENDFLNACFEAIRENIESAVHRLSSALEQRQASLKQINQEPCFDFIRDDTPFKEYISKHQALHE